MKIIILAGGYGSRLSEETILKPKPLVEIAGKPIIWHIMKFYAHYGYNDFIICCGYKGHLIKEYFSNYFINNKVLKIDLEKNIIEKEDKHQEPWKITLVDTGLDVATGGRLKKIYQYVKNEKYVALTYGDGLSNVNLHELEKFHIKMNKLATVTAVRPAPRFGYLNIDKKNIVQNFEEKKDSNESFINGGFFIVNPRCFEGIESDNTPWERNPMENLAKNGQLAAFVHKDFWMPMDTLRDKNLLENLWKMNKAKWKVW